MGGYAFARRAGLGSAGTLVAKGLIEEEGPPEQLFGQPRSERLRQFLSATMPKDAAG